MPLAKTGTCPNCDFEKMHCICDNQRQRNHNTGKRNTTGDLVRPDYQNYSQQDDYTRRQHYDPNSYERKFMEEFFPIDQEVVSTYIARTNMASNKIIESSIHKHLYGGAKVWPCHTTSRYCPVCILAQQVEQLRQLIIALSETQDMSKIQLNVQQSDSRTSPTITITLLS